MATSYSSHLAPPGEFNFAKLDEWPKWKKRFEQYRNASGLDTEPETQQIDTLLYCLGGKADSVLTSTNITAEDRKKYQKVIDKFDSHFKVRRNTIFERAGFYLEVPEGGGVVRTIHHRTVPLNRVLGVR